MIVRLDRLPDGRTAVRPEGHARWSYFIEALRAAGGKRDKRLAAHVCEYDQTPRLIDELVQRNFEVRASAELEEALGTLEEVVRRRKHGAGGLAAALKRRVEDAGGKLYPFQQRGVAWLAQRNRALLADEMGVGKTVQALMAMPKGTGAVVVCPAVVKGVWRDEAARWRPDFDVTVLKGRGSFRWPRLGEVIVINYALLPAAVKAGRGFTIDPDLGHPPLGCTIIADEAHKVKTAKSQRTRNFKAMSRAALKAGGNVWLLTGTPMLGNPLELYNVLRAADLEVEAFGPWNEFCRLFDMRRGGYRGKQLLPGTPAPEVPKLLSRVCMRRTREQVLPELPEKIVRTVTVDCIDSRTRKVCDEVIATLRAAGVDLTESALDVDLSDRQEVMKCIAAARSALAAAKVPALQEWVETYEANREPLVVFSAHRAPIDLLAKREGWVTITGEVDPESRADIARDFREGKYKGLAATISAAGVGLTLCGGPAKAGHAVFVDLDWTPALNAQAADRLHRMGQTRGVLITHLVADHILDQHLTDLLLRKERLIAATMPTTE